MTSVAKKRNPKWNAEETILGLDIIYQKKDKIRNAEIVALSDLLDKAAFHNEIDRGYRFRNEKGIRSKLSYLSLAIKKQGSAENTDLKETSQTSPSKIEMAIVNQYPISKKDDLHNLANAIRKAIDKNDIPKNISDADSFVEGKIVTSKHLSREAKLRKLLLEKHKGNLVCEICEFTPPAIDDILRESFFEAHHIELLSSFKAPKSTNVNDLSLLCACCHRLIHKVISTRKRWTSPQEVRKDMPELGISRFRLPSD